MEYLFDLFNYTYVLFFVFLATLVLITINNISNQFEIKKHLNTIRLVIIVSGVISILKIIYLLYPFKDNLEPYTVFDLFLLIALLLPFLLFIKKLGRNKYFILLVPFLIFLISLIANFERLVIIVTSLHRGHLPASWSMFYPTWQELPFFILKTLLFLSPFILLIVNLIIYVRKKLKKKA